MQLPTDEQHIAIPIIRELSTIIPDIGAYVASTRNPHTMGLSVKTTNGVFQISLNDLESYRKNPQSLNDVDFNRIGQSFKVDV